MTGPMSIPVRHGLETNDAPLAIDLGHTKKLHFGNKPVIDLTPAPAPRIKET